MARADLLVRHQSRAVQHSKVAGNRGPADGQLVRYLLDRVRSAGQELHDCAAVRVAKGVERITLARSRLHELMVTEALR